VSFWCRSGFFFFFSFSPFCRECGGVHVAAKAAAAFSRAGFSWLLPPFFFPPFLLRSPAPGRQPRQWGMVNRGDAFAAGCPLGYWFSLPPFFFFLLSLVLSRSESYMRGGKNAAAAPGLGTSISSPRVHRLFFFFFFSFPFFSFAGGAGRGSYRERGSLRQSLEHWLTTGFPMDASCALFSFFFFFLPLLVSICAVPSAAHGRIYLV